jgi:hypothetical protein
MQVAFGRISNNLGAWTEALGTNGATFVPNLARAERESLTLSKCVLFAPAVLLHRLPARVRERGSMAAHPQDYEFNLKARPFPIRRELPTTDKLENTIAPAARIGFKIPVAAKVIAAVL